MAETLKVQLEDTDGNIYYLKTDANNVFCTDGQSVQTKLDAKIDTSNIIQNTDTNDGSKVPSSAVTANLQTQIDQINNKAVKYDERSGKANASTVYIYIKDNKLISTAIQMPRVSKGTVKITNVSSPYTALSVGGAWFTVNNSNDNFWIESTNTNALTFFGQVHADLPIWIVYYTVTWN